MAWDPTARQARNLLNVASVARSWFTRATGVERRPVTAIPCAVRYLHVGKEFHSGPRLHSGCAHFCAFSPTRLPLPLVPPSIPPPLPLPYLFQTSNRRTGFARSHCHGIFRPMPVGRPVNASSACEAPQDAAGCPLNGRDEKKSARYPTWPELAWCGPLAGIREGGDDA